MVIIALDEQATGWPSAVEQATITAQQDASLLRCTTQELVIGGRRIVDDIDPHHT
jgi:hypothetical protein